MFLGAMNNISDSVLEAAKIDGASFLREFVYVVIPLVYPTFVVFVTVGVVQIFTNQLALYSFYGDSAELQDYTIGYYLYRGVQAGGFGLSLPCGQSGFSAPLWRHPLPSLSGSS